MNTLCSYDTPVIVGGMKERQTKRDRQITIRISSQDLNLMKQAAEVAWPGALLSTAAIMLSLSRMKAKEILEQA